MKKDDRIDQLFELFDTFLDPSDVLYSKLMAQISSAIIKERLKMRMTQCEFSKYIDVKQSLISRWEQGNYNFSLKKMAEIATKLNLDVNLIFCNVKEHRRTGCFSEGFSATRIIQYSSNQSASSITKTFIKEEKNNYVTVR